MTTAASMTAGCISSPSNRATNRFMAEYNCPNVLMKRLSPNVTRVRGCGHVATYICGSQCIKDSERVAPETVSTRRAPAASSSAETGIKTGESQQGNRAVQTVFRRIEGTITISALPIASPDEVRIKATLHTPCANCEAKLAVDGELIPMQHVSSTTASSRTIEARFAAPDLVKMAGSTKTTFRFGQTDWELSDEDKHKVQEFIMTCRQEQALAGQVTPVSQGSAPSDSL